MGFKTKTGVKKSQKKSHEQIRNRSSGKEDEEGACDCMYCMYVWGNGASAMSKQK
jgi:hypothetical protein